VKRGRRLDGKVARTQRRVAWLALDCVMAGIVAHRAHRCCRDAAILLADSNATHHDRASAMAHFIEQLVNAVTLGAIYGLIAIGYTMVYGIIGMVNFAHGDVFMVGSFIALIFILLLGVSGATPFLLLILALVFVLALAMALTSAYRPLRGSLRLAPLISAIGMSIVLANLVQIVQGANVKPLQPIVTGAITLVPALGGLHAASISNIQVLIIVTTVGLMALFTWVVKATPLGRAQRAVEQDRTMAALTGVDVDRTIAITFVIGAALAAVAGMMFLLYYGVIDFFIGFVAGIKAFTAAVLGGIGSLPGAMLGGVVIALVETFWADWVGSAYKDVAAFSILILILIFMPQGLLGRPDVEKV
jgi:branched-chain amino acid transport system permease protein